LPALLILSRASFVCRSRSLTPHQERRVRAPDFYSSLVILQRRSLRDFHFLAQRFLFCAPECAARFRP
jgi:hypothetical protein